MTLTLFNLPSPDCEGGIPFHKVLAGRRSIREFRPDPLFLHDLSQLLWAAQGEAHPRGLRTVPSAGATYPLEVDAVIGEIEGLSPGVYRYLPQGHQLLQRLCQDLRGPLYRAALEQRWVREAPLVLAISAIYGRTTHRYGERGFRYVHMEVGHVAQNIHLQATALGLGTVVVGAFDDKKVSEVLQLGKETALCLMPLGRMR